MILGKNVQNWFVRKINKKIFFRILKTKNEKILNNNAVFSIFSPIHISINFLMIANGTVMWGVQFLHIKSPQLDLAFQYLDSIELKAIEVVAFVFIIFLPDICDKSKKIFDEIRPLFVGHYNFWQW